MRTAVGLARALGITLVAGGTVVGCSSASTATAPTPTTSSTAAPTTTTAAAPTTTAAASATVSSLPAVPSAATVGTCPYLSEDDVAQINGEKNLGVKIAPAAAAADPPACFFYTYGDQQQMSTWVFRASSPAQATAAVNRAAPVKTTDPADQPAGWSGGSTGGADGAVYAVAKGAVAVVVTSNQDQSVKARRAAEQIIDNLGL